ncbi:MAG: peptide ABC transporter substrate-binding protein [Alkalispirochaetaceae bacterium]
MNRSFPRFLGVLLVTALLLFGCATIDPEGEAPLPEEPSTSQEDSGEDEGRDRSPEESQNDEPDLPEELRVAFSPTELSLNPMYSFTTTEAQIFTALFEGLLSYTPLTLEPRPAVAERWEVSPDGLTYTFYLRENARYWNGDSVTAEDFRRTWLELLDPERESAYSFLFDIIEGAEAYRNGENDDPNSVALESIGEKVLEVGLTNPASHFLRILAHHSFVPVHESVRTIEDWSEFTTIPGNGPYYISTRGEESLSLRRNEVYWDRQNVAIPRIELLFPDREPDQITERFNGGDYHWVTGGMSLANVEFTENIVINPLFATTYYYIASDEPPLDNPDVRRALALLLPLEELRSEEFQFIPASTLVPPIPFYPEVTGLEAQNRDEARELLSAAGVSDSDDLGPIRVAIPGGEESRRVAGIMEATWEEALGVTVEVEEIPYPRYFDALDDGEYTVGTVSWVADYADPLSFLQMWMSGSNLNNANFGSDEFDGLIRSSYDQTGDTRYATLAEAERILLETAVVLPVSHSPAINLVNGNEIEGWFPNPLDIHPFKEIRFRELAPIPGVASSRRELLLPAGFIPLRNSVD